MPGRRSSSRRSPLNEEPPSDDHLAGGPGRLKRQAEKLAQFRKDYAARFQSQSLTGRAFGRPRNKNEQVDWCVYTQMVDGQHSDWKIAQQHLIVPLFVPQPLAGPTGLISRKPATELFATRTGAEHVSNIARMEALLRRHPLVELVEQFKNEEKATTATAKDAATGRATKGHQSPNDVRIFLAATGAKMELGCTANRIKNDSLALWWKPVNPFSEEDQEKMHLIFFDVTEVACKVANPWKCAVPGRPLGPPTEATPGGPLGGHRRVRSPIPGRFGGAPHRGPGRFFGGAEGSDHPPPRAHFGAPGGPFWGPLGSFWEPVGPFLKPPGGPFCWGPGVAGGLPRDISISGGRNLAEVHNYLPRWAQVVAQAAAPSAEPAPGAAASSSDPHGKSSGSAGQPQRPRSSSRPLAASNFEEMFSAAGAPEPPWISLATPTPPPPPPPPPGTPAALAEAAAAAAGAPSPPNPRRLPKEVTVPPPSAGTTPPPAVAPAAAGAPPPPSPPPAKEGSPAAVEGPPAAKEGPPAKRAHEAPPAAKEGPPAAKAKTVPPAAKEGPAAKRAHEAPPAAKEGPPPAKAKTVPPPPKAPGPVEAPTAAKGPPPYVAPPAAPGAPKEPPPPPTGAPNEPPPPLPTPLPPAVGKPAPPVKAPPPPLPPPQAEMGPGWLDTLD